MDEEREIKEFKQPGTGVGNFQGGYKKSELREFSQFNMAAILFERQNVFLNQAHDLHYRAGMTFDKNGTMLIQCYHALRHASVITKFALAAKDHKKLDGELSELAQKIKQGVSQNNGLTQPDYSSIHGYIFLIFETLYSGQQDMNMGIPKDKYRDAESRIRDAVRS